jgi:hypothetical protein
MRTPSKAPYGRPAPEPLPLTIKIAACGSPLLRASLAGVFNGLFLGQSRLWLKKSCTIGAHFPLAGMNRNPAKSRDGPFTGVTGGKNLMTQGVKKWI